MNEISLMSKPRGWGGVSKPCVSQLFWTASLLPYSYALACKLPEGQKLVLCPKAESGALAFPSGMSTVFPGNYLRDYRVLSTRTRTW